MPSFSERKGLVTVSELIQVGSMNTALRNSIWNVLDRVWSSTGFMGPYGQHGPMEIFSRVLWEDFYKLPADERGDFNFNILESIRERFFAVHWNRVYDFLEFVVQPYVGLPTSLTQELNKVLQREGAGYTIIGGLVVDITSEQEVAMLQEALSDNSNGPVAAHLQRALEFLTNRDNPDPRNSIKESISAVEAMAKIVADLPKATLADALKSLEKKGKLHSALKDGFKSLYGYTNDADGIRHAMMDESNLTQADARYFLMSCTAFTNYLKALPTQL